MYYPYPCSTPGLNILSCNAYSDRLSYCYFDMENSRCLSFGTIYSRTPAQASGFFSDNEMICEQLNYLGCPQNVWSPE
jgi:hypothetical protein